MNATIEAVTERIRRRTAEDRAGYLERIEAALIRDAAWAAGGAAQFAGGQPGMLIGALTFGHLPNRGRVRSN